MSAAVNRYIMLGAKFQFKPSPYNFEDFEDYLDNHNAGKVTEKNGLTCIYDGMNGKYIMLGKVLHKSGNYEEFDHDVIELPRGTDFNLFVNIRESIMTAFPLLPNANIKLYFVTHYH